VFALNADHRPEQRRRDKPHNDVRHLRRIRQSAGQFFHQGFHHWTSGKMHGREDDEPRSALRLVLRQQ
jgi:hypothetical protein